VDSYEIKEPDGEAHPEFVRPVENEQVVLGGQEDEGEGQDPDDRFFNHGF